MPSGEEAIVIDLRRELLAPSSRRFACSLSRNPQWDSVSSDGAPPNCPPRGAYSSAKLIRLSRSSARPSEKLERIAGIEPA